MSAMRLVAALALSGLAMTPLAAQAQSVHISRSILPDQPYTLIYPEAMMASGAAGEPVTINHPNAPLQCDLTVVDVEDTDWSAQTALAELDEEAVTSAWAADFPGFAITSAGTTDYQNASALIYDGTSTDSPMGLPLTIVHTETVADGRGYALDCIYATEVAPQARPIVDFIIANFATRADADCCIGAAVDPGETAPQ